MFPFGEQQIGMHCENDGRYWLGCMINRRRSQAWPYRSPQAGMGCNPLDGQTSLELIMSSAIIMPGLLSNLNHPCNVSHISPVQLVFAECHIQLAGIHGPMHLFALPTRCHDADVIMGEDRQRQIDVKGRFRSNKTMNV